MNRLVKGMWPLNILVAVALVATLALAGPAAAQRRNGTTLAAYKTVDICKNADGTWRFFGDISLWNEGAVDTQGIAATDCIQYKVGAGAFADAGAPYCTSTFDPPLTNITAGTTLLTASVFHYAITAPALDLTAGYVRNRVQVTITNHSGHLTVPFGPEPKATYDGDNPPQPCETGPSGCTFTQGYWGSKPGVVWPPPYDRTAVFFQATTKGACISGCDTPSPRDDMFEQVPATWQDVLNTPVSVANGYYQLADQYIAAVLNIANGASVPTGVQDTLDLALAWLTLHSPSECTAGGSCGTQTTWAGVLDEYNNGHSEGGPPHCAE